MKFRAIFAWLLCMVCALGLVACGETEELIETTPTTVATTPTTAAIIEEDLSAMISKEEISAAVGVEMSDPTVSEQGAVLTSVGTESMVTLSVEVSEKPREIFDQILLNFPVLTACPNLGETAWFSADYHQLLVYDHERMMTVELIGLEGDDDDRELLRCRQIAATILERLPVEE